MIAAHGVADVVHELQSFSVNVDVADPHANSEELLHEYGFGLIDEFSKPYDAIILAVNHQEYVDQGPEFFKDLLVPGGLLFDVKGIKRGKADGLVYKSL